MQPNLDSLLAYKNRHVIARYKKDYAKNKMSAQTAFKELLKFLWLCEKHDLDKATQQDAESLHFTCLMHAEMSDIDDMWHTFLLFTRDYQEFCDRYFGHFIHHQPLTPRQKIRFKRDYERELTCYLTYIYENLGPRTLKCWFREN